jgi:hypothetical protein
MKPWQVKDASSHQAPWFWREPIAIAVGVEDAQKE